MSRLEKNITVFFTNDGSANYVVRKMYKGKVYKKTLAYLFLARYYRDNCCNDKPIDINKALNNQ